MKTLRQLWQESGCQPFDAASVLGGQYHFIKISYLTSHAIGLDEDGKRTTFYIEAPCWSLVTSGAAKEIEKTKHYEAELKHIILDLDAVNRMIKNEEDEITATYLSGVIDSAKALLKIAKGE